MQTTLWSKCIRYECHGNPKEVLSLCTVPINPNRWDANAVLVRWLASPVNPLDLNIIEGRYSLIRPELPAVAGCEAVGSVERISSNVEHLKVGDRVIRFRMPSSDAANGVWAEWAIVDAGILLKIDPKIDLISAATLAINPPTAMALLREFVTLEVDDWVIQNAANSGVGRAVIQLAKYYGYRTFNLIRSNSASESTKAELRSLGADLVMTEEEFGADLKVNKTALPSGQPRLALNGVGGRSALLISSALARRGVLVTYGGMSKRPSEIATGAFVFNGISAYGFSLGSWVMESENEAKVDAIFKELQHLIVSGKLRPPPARFVPMFEFGEAIENAISHGTKQILLIQPEAGSNKL